MVTADFVSYDKIETLYVWHINKNKQYNKFQFEIDINQFN